MQDRKDYLAEAYRRNIDTVYRVCWLYMKNVSDTEDAVSDTFVRLMRSDMTFESEEHEKAWLIAAARNICRDVLKSPKRKNEPLDENMLTGENLTDETLAAVKELPEKYRTAVYLYYYEVEMNVKTISVSPLNCVIKGTADLSQPVNSISFAHGWGNIWFVLKNGERVCLQSDYMGSTIAEGKYFISMIANYSPRRGLLDLNEIEAIEFDSFTVPFNSGETSETEEIPE